MIENLPSRLISFLHKTTEYFKDANLLYVFKCKCIEDHKSSFLELASISKEFCENKMRILQKFWFSIPKLIFKYLNIKSHNEGFILPGIAI